MRVLVIEDEDKMADVLKRGLEEESFDVDVASDGNRGLELAKTTQPDFIILEHCCCPMLLCWFMAGALQVLW